MNKSIVSFVDFQKLDFRVGKILEVQAVENSDKLIKLKVDLGKDYGIRTILGGFKGVYPDEELIGKKYVFLANLEPKKMMGEESQGMIIAADVDDKPVLVNVQNEVVEGTVVR